ncbi:MAG: hypothetical protein ACLFQJ_07130 [Campylobacterales bacterium]
MKKSLVSLFLAMGLSGSAFAHTALMSCFDNGDGTVTCEGGFSDGSSASGVDFYIIVDGKKMNEVKFDEFGEVTYNKPDGSYSAFLYAGEGHEIEVKSSDILE